jgi:sec-independent protein translocase protein TatA
MFGGFGMVELIIILIIAMIFFGPGKLPELGSSIGKAIKGFKKSVEDPAGKQDGSIEDNKAGKK